MRAGRRALVLLWAVAFGAALGYLAGLRDVEIRVMGAEDAGRAYLFLQVLKANPATAVEVCGSDSECEAAGYLAGI